ncbi:DUF6950 family protein [Ketogulonicigenium vulgare]|uniref:DUF6950 family protein n=1 Tax=Ketogulonicigenium vulgare TaxID=92945 RepID=UPI002358622C|nr:hypothetical protein [Ketogulonicigenium vulgare]
MGREGVTTSLVAALAAYVGLAAQKPFAYGAHDCALFAAGWVLERTGQDLGASFRGRYSTERGGLRVVRAAGFADHVAVFRAALTARSGWMAAMPGDVVAVLGEGRFAALGIAGHGVAYVFGDQGLTIVSLETATEVFAL